MGQYEDKPWGDMQKKAIRGHWWDMYNCTCAWKTAQTYGEWIWYL
jgi:hypothetical protein